MQYTNRGKTDTTLLLEETTSRFLKVILAHAFASRFLSFLAVL